MQRSSFQNPASHEAALTDYATRVGQHRKDRRALHIRLSQLSRGSQFEHHIRIAMNTFDPLLKRFEGQIFRMWNNDLIVTVKGASLGQMDEYAIRLQFLFSGDPNISTSDDNEFQLCHWYEMESDYPAFRKLAETFEKQAAEKRERNEKTQSPDAISSLGSAGAAVEPLTPILLERFEAALETADLSPMVQQQMICAIPKGGEPQAVMEECFVSIAALQKQFLPGVNCLSDKWLFQRICQRLDYRMLAALPELVRKATVPLSINVNVATLLSPEFLKFDERYQKLTQLPLILELQSIDLFGDMGAFMFAREFVHERGYRLALDGLDQMTFPLIDRRKLKLDFQKIQWNPEILSDIRAKRREEFIAAVNKTGATRVILCRCDDQRAVDFGKSVGISLFQGRYLDQLLRRKAA